MIMLIKLIGILIFCMGIFMMVRPEVARKMISFWLRGKNLYLGGIIRLVLGILFLIAAYSARLPGLMFVIGFLALIGGILIFALGLDRTKAMVNRFKQLPDPVLRLMMLLVLVFGALIVYAA